MNMKELTKRVTNIQRRGKCPPQSMAQVKETLRISFDVLANEVQFLEVMEMFSRYEREGDWRTVRKCF